MSDDDDYDDDYSEDEDEDQNCNNIKTYEDNRNFIKKFVLKLMRKYDFERDHDQWLGFKKFSEFRKKNKQMIELCSNSDIDWLMELIKKINSNKIKNMDKDSMVPFDVSGFCWNNYNKLVIYNNNYEIHFYI